MSLEEWSYVLRAVGDPLCRDRTPFPTLPSLSAIRAGERPPRVSPQRAARRAQARRSPGEEPRARAAETSSAASSDTVSGIAPAAVAISGRLCAIASAKTFTCWDSQLKFRFARDSPLEESGFEPSIPSDRSVSKRDSSPYGDLVRPRPALARLLQLEEQPAGPL
jgi:hypothetical protein